MFTRILTAQERAAIKKYLAKDGEKEAKVRDLAYRANKHVFTMEQDLELIHRFLSAYKRP